MYLLLWVCGCVWLLMPQENQTELNKRRHSHPSQSLPIAGDDRQNADTTLFSNWIWDIIYSCFNMSGKSCGNNTQSLTFVPSLSLCVFLWIGGRMDGWMERLNVTWYKSCFLSVAHTGKHQYTEKYTANPAWDPISRIHYSVFLSGFACLMAITPRLELQKAKPHILLKKMSST